MEALFASTQTGHARVSLCVREREIASLPVELVANTPQVVLLTPSTIADLIADTSMKTPTDNAVASSQKADSPKN